MTHELRPKGAARPSPALHQSNAEPQFSKRPTPFVTVEAYDSVQNSSYLPPAIDSFTPPAEPALTFYSKTSPPPTPAGPELITARPHNHQSPAESSQTFRREPQETECHVIQDAETIAQTMRQTGRADVRVHKKFLGDFLNAEDIDGIAYRIEGLDDIEILKIRSAVCGKRTDNEQGIVTSMRIQSNLKDRGDARILRMRAGVAKPTPEKGEVSKLIEEFYSLTSQAELCTKAEEWVEEMHRPKTTGKKHKTTSYYIGPSLAHKMNCTLQCDSLLHAHHLPEKINPILEKAGLRTTLEGITTTYWHVGDHSSATAFHCEDVGFRSLNITLYGRKIWVMVDNEDTEAFEQYVAGRYNIKQEAKCDQWVRHLGLFISPSSLRVAGIRFKIVVACPGDLVVTKPRQYHFVINLGLTFAVAINHALKQDGTFNQRRKVCPDCGLFGYATCDNLRLERLEAPNSLTKTTTPTAVPDSTAAEHGDAPTRKRKPQGPQGPTCDSSSNKRHNKTAGLLNGFTSAQSSRRVEDDGTSSTATMNKLVDALLDEKAIRRGIRRIKAARQLPQLGGINRSSKPEELSNVLATWASKFVGQSDLTKWFGNWLVVDAVRAHAAAFGKRHCMEVSTRNKLVKTFDGHDADQDREADKDDATNAKKSSKDCDTLARITKLGRIFDHGLRGLFLFITLEVGTRNGATFRGYQRVRTIGDIDLLRKKLHSEVRNRGLETLCSVGSDFIDAFFTPPGRLASFDDKPLQAILDKMRGQEPPRPGD